MNCAHLFNGIGGFALAAHWMGWENVMHCEIDPFCNKVMNHHFPNSYQHEDIRTTDFTIWRGRIDFLTGGEPCQPSSVAGKRQGKEDDRYLWPEYYRAVKEIRPKWIVNENVPGTVSNGILDQKISDLEDANYSWWPPFVIPACATGADHLRNRVWLVAHSNGSAIGHNTREVPCATEAIKRAAQGSYRKWCRPEFSPASQTAWLEVASFFHGMVDGLPDRVDRRQSLANAIVPQVAFEIFKAIDHAHSHL